jgi:hypothetical protein
VPRAPLDVQAGTTGLGVSPDPGTVLLAEKQRATPSSPSSEPRGQRGLIFGEPGAVADGGIFYDNAGSNAMEFRTTGTCPAPPSTPPATSSSVPVRSTRWRLLSATSTAA